jgi:NAD(P)-dependent dehydrogenase (short-subunit alcohol dehydrogenase family)
MAKNSTPGLVRVVWTSSRVVDFSAPNGGIDMKSIAAPNSDHRATYVRSKTGNWFLASELARQVGPEGIISMVQNPGGTKTNLFRNETPFFRFITSPFLSHARFGAYTLLWTGLSPEVTLEKNGGYVIPWGRIHSGPRQDLLDALKSVDEGGTGQAGEFSQ